MMIYDQRWKNRGSLTIEATVSLLLFTLFLLFFLNFARVYRAQNLVASGAYNAAKDLSIEYYGKSAYEKTSVGKIMGFYYDIVELINLISTNTSQGQSSTDWYGDLPTAAKNKFGLAITAQMQKEYSADAADRALKAVGIKDGLDGLDFSASMKNGDDVEISINYTVELMFPSFGISEISMTQKAVSKLWQYSEKE